MKKDNTIDVFFALVKAGLWEQDISLSEYDKIDFDLVLQLAQEQTVVGLVAAGLEHVKSIKIPQEVALNFVGNAVQLEQRNLAMNNFIAEYVGKMRRVGIYTLLVKGQGVAQCYTRPLWRSCGDVDFFLSENNYIKAKEYLLPLSTSNEKDQGGKHFEMTIDTWVVELHGWLRCGISSRINKVLDDIQRQTFFEGVVRSWNNEGVQIFMLGKENDVFYVFTHFLNHFYKGGIGLRQICDWCRLLWSFRESLTVSVIENRIRKAGLMSEWKAFAAFAVKYLGMPCEAVPLYSSSVKWEKKADRICSFILKVGNFGHKRDMSYYNKYPYLIRKSYSLGRRILDLYSHARIFPIDSLRFFPYVILTGIKTVSRGE